MLRIAMPIAALLLTLVPAAQAASDQLKDQDSVQRQTEAFMEKVVQGKVNTAYRQLRPYLGVDTTPYDKSADEAAEYFQQVTDRAGKAIDYSHARLEVINADFTRTTWLQKFESAAIAWQFTFYQPEDDGWKLVGVSYSTDIENLYRTVE